MTAPDALASTTPASTAPAFVAVDGGNSKTHVVVGDQEGRVLSEARGGPSCHQMVGLEAAMATLDATIVEALAALRTSDDTGGIVGTGEASTTVPLGVYCLAGLDLPVDDLRLAPAIAELGHSIRDVLHNDTIAILRAGCSSGWGVGLVCGAGLNCAGLAPDGRTVRFPAMGELSGDFAPGGVWLGMRALGLALRAEDRRGAPSRLEALVPEALGRATPLASLEAVYTGELAFDRLPQLAPLVFDAAAAGDAPARQTLDLLADEIVAMATSVIRRLGLEHLAVEVVAGGGIFRNDDAEFEQRVRHGVQAVAPLAHLVTLEAPPVLGAALLAADELTLGDDAEARLRAALGDEPDVDPDDDPDDGRGRGTGSPSEAHAG